VIKKTASENKQNSLIKKWAGSLLPKKKCKNKYSQMSKEDKEIQLKYDLLKKEKKLPKPTYEQLVYVPLKKRKKNK